MNRFNLGRARERAAAGAKREQGHKARGGGALVTQARGATRVAGPLFPATPRGPGRRPHSGGVYAARSPPHARPGRPPRRPHPRSGSRPRSRTFPRALHHPRRRVRPAPEVRGTGGGGEAAGCGPRPGTRPRGRDGAGAPCRDLSRDSSPGSLLFLLRVRASLQKRGPRTILVLFSGGRGAP